MTARLPAERWSERIRSGPAGRRGRSRDAAREPPARVWRASVPRPRRDPTRADGARGRLPRCLPLATERSRLRGFPRSSRTTACSSASDSSRRPSVTASTIPRLRAISSIIVSSIVSAASRYQAVTASSWPMRWQRSSAWSWMAGVHSRSRNATLEARVSVIPGRPRAWSRRSAAGRRGSGTPAPRPRARARVAAEQVRGVREALEHEVLDLAVAGEHDERLVDWPGSRRSSASAGPSLPRAASRLAR